MNYYTNLQYLYIAIANAFGLDKLTFEDRIQWAESNNHQFDKLSSQASEKLLYKKAVHTYQKAKQGTPTGFMCALDAVCSGTQIMSVLTGCKSGATATGLVDPNRRADAYSDLIEEMNTMLDEPINNRRDDVKQAFMTFNFGSKAVPKKLFGEETPAYEAFIQGVKNIAGGAVECRDALIKAWKPYAKEHSFTVPDGHRVILRTQKKVSYEFELPDINAKYVLHYSAFEGTQKGVALCAHVIHA